MQAQYVNAEDIKGDNSIVLDFGQDDEIIPENLPNANDILDNVIAIMEYANTSEMKQLKVDNANAYLSTMEQKFESFAERYYSVFRMVISGNDISPLFEMLTVINNMRTGAISVERGEHQVGTRLKEFLPPGFEEKLQRETVENMKKAHKKK
jgi:hypothetical protein